MLSLLRPVGLSRHARRWVWESAGAGGTNTAVDTATNMDMTCADCARDIDHCHGTLVAHRDDAAHCTDDRCALLDPARHPLVVSCAAIHGGCGCVDAGLDGLAAMAASSASGEH